MSGIDGGKPLEQWLTQAWQSIDPSFRRAFFAVVAISLLAFGFEMTNLTLHHDDVNQIFIQDTILGHYLGRFGTGWLHYYVQQAHVMPFLQMAEGIVLMTAYGLIVARLWGVRRTLDIVLVAAVLCVFPYMAQLYQYNTAMATYTLAHLLAAWAVGSSVKARPVPVLLAALAYLFAFSIYQSVIANAATVFLFWALARLLAEPRDGGADWPALLRAALAALLAVGSGGAAYLGIVSQMGLQAEASHAAGEAFAFRGGLQLSLALPEILQGTRAFYFWPEHYFPDYLKKLQLLFVLGAAALCLVLPRGAARKAGALALLGIALLAPRLLQLIHPRGDFHNLALTAYAVAVAGCLMVLLRVPAMRARNLGVLAAGVLVAGYLVQANWISSVNHLNMLAHYSSMTRIVGRLHALPAEGWDGQTVAVSGSHPMYSGYPFRQATGVAPEFIDTQHMQRFAYLLRENMRFVDIADAPEAARQYAATHPRWPHPDSVAVAGGMAVLILSRNAAESGTPTAQR